MERAQRGREIGLRSGRGPRGCGGDRALQWHQAAVFARGTLLTLAAVSGLFLGCTTHPTDREASGTAESMSSGRAARPASPVLFRSAWNDRARPGVLLTTDRYRLYLSGVDAAVADRLPEFCELLLTRYTSAFGPLPGPEGKIETYVVSGRAEWARFASERFGSSASSYLSIARGGLSRNGVCITHDLGPRDTFLIIAHEGWHQYTQRAFVEPLPLAFEEGLACFMEGHAFRDAVPVLDANENPERRSQLAAAVRRGGLIPLPALLADDLGGRISRGGDDVLDYYAHAWALILFLESTPATARALRELLRDASGGNLTPVLRSMSLTTSASDVLSAYVGRSAESLDAEYRAFVAALVR